MTTRLAFLLKRADQALAAKHYKHALWLCGRVWINLNAPAPWNEEPLDEDTLAAVTARVQRIETAAKEALAAAAPTSAG